MWQQHQQHHDNDGAHSEVSILPNTEVPQLPDPNVMNSIAAKEMHAMSACQREVVYEEIHGVAVVEAEQHEVVSKAFHELQVALDKTRNKPAYDIAVSQGPNYVQGRSLRLMFLRATNFDAQKAATKMIKFFEYKRLYFGDELLGRPIRYDDMNANDLDWLKSGSFQVLPFRDKAGRAVVWFLMKSLPNGTAINGMRALWYFFALILKDEDTQKSGIVFFASGGGLDLSQKSREFAWHGSLFGTYFPIRPMCLHICVENQAATRMVSLAQLGWNKELRARIRIHSGSQTEWMYSLMTFGIPVDYAPVTSNGNIKLKYFRQWLIQKCAVEAQEVTGQLFVAQHQTQKTIIDLPRRNDILLGKGSVQQKYSGNHLFLQVIYENQDRYLASTSRNERMDIAKDVWRLLQNENARFLERHDGSNSSTASSWEEVTDSSKILTKIAIQLRSKKTIPGGCGNSSGSSVPNNKNDNHKNNNKKEKAEAYHDVDNSNTSFLNDTECDVCCSGRPMKRTRF